MPVGCRNSGTSARAKSSTPRVGPCPSYLHSFQMKKVAGHFYGFQMTHFWRIISKKNYIHKKVKAVDVKL